jgi:uncharacterized repeat protein (TIGR03803 family)
MQMVFLNMRAAATVIGATVMLCVALPSASAGTYQVLYDFCVAAGCLDGADATNTLLKDPSGRIFGTTGSGGADDGGVVFELAPGAGGYTYSVLYSFCQDSSCADGALPSGGLIEDTAGNLYGVTNQGGAHDLGDVFELTPGAGGWSYQILYSFCSDANCADGEHPVGALTYSGAAAGSLYDGTSPLFGTTQDGGNGSGTVYAMQPGAGSWTLQTIFAPASANGDYPKAGPTMDASGNLYVPFLNNFEPAAGGIFQLTQSDGSWAAAVLYGYGNRKENLVATGGVTIDSKGRIWGPGSAVNEKASKSCRTDCGILYGVARKGKKYQVTNEYSFCATKACADGSMPVANLVIDADSNVFGATQTGGDNRKHGSGTLFEFSTSGFDVLHTFCSQSGCTDGARPMAAPIEDSSGNLFGTTVSGGAYKNGVVYEYVP